MPNWWKEKPESRWTCHSRSLPAGFPKHSSAPRTNPDCCIPLLLYVCNFSNVTPLLHSYNWLLVSNPWYCVHDSYRSGHTMTAGCVSTPHSSANVLHSATTSRFALLSVSAWSSPPQPPPDFCLQVENSSLQHITLSPQKHTPSYSAVAITWSFSG